MAVAGGVCFVLLYGIFSRYPAMPILLRSLIGATVITAVEFLAGTLVNIRLRLAVWDYSAMPYNLYGQVCPQYFFLWFLLCFPISVVVDCICTVRSTL